MSLKMTHDNIGLEKDRLHSKKMGSPLNKNRIQHWKRS